MTNDEIINRAVDVAVAIASNTYLDFDESEQGDEKFRTFVAGAIRISAEVISAAVDKLNLERPHGANP